MSRRTILAYVACFLAAGVGAGCAAVSGTQQTVTVVPELTATTTNSFYVSNRAPLAPSPVIKLPPGAIVPEGWLREQLELDAGGLVGRMAEISPFLKYEGNGWVDTNADNGWEELPYWLRGYGDLGYVLNNPEIIANTRKWVNGILSDQREDGYFGPLRLKTAEHGQADLWPHMLILDALHSYYEFSGDERVLQFMRRYFQWQNRQPLASFKVGWGAQRWADNLAEICWLYNQTGEPWLLDLARKIHENSIDYTTGIPNWHNVNLAQGIREPAEYWMLDGEPKYLAATETNYDTIMGTWGQFAGGGFAGDENVRQEYYDPRQGFETCGIVEFMHTFEMMTRISGNPLWADRAEDIAFNSFPAALSPDHRGTHYITSANSIQLDNVPKKHGQFDNGFAMQAYKPGIFDYRCCPHNLSMGWPYYAEELWLATADDGLCASLYAASEVKAKVGDGTEVRIAEQTDYPFEEAIQLKISAPKAVNFPLYLRVPRWCAQATLAINGQAVAVQAGASSYIVIRRTWREGDAVTLRLPMQIAVRHWAKNKNSVSVDYGPLSFSLDIQEKWSRYGGTDEWPEYDVLPESPWNYGLIFNPNTPADSFEIMRKPGPLAANPFTPETVPISLVAEAKRIPGWQADSDQVVDVLPASPVQSDAPLEKVTLIPMGAARLRITSFPVIEGGEQAH